MRQFNPRVCARCTFYTDDRLEAARRDRARADARAAQASLPANCCHGNDPEALNCYGCPGHPAFADPDLQPQEDEA